MKYLCTLLLCGLLVQLKAQVIDIESERIHTDTTGWAGSASGTFHIYKDNFVLYDLSTAVHIQYKTKRSLFLLLNNIDLISVDYPNAPDEPFENSGLQHFRYNYKITDRFVWEAFLQGQYNDAMGIDWRFLAGTGPRYKIVGKDKFRLYAAAAYMYEKEQDNDDTPVQNNHRMSDYISFTLRFGNSSLVSTTYYQPLITDFSDYHIASNFELQISIKKNFYFTTSYSLIYDTNPPAGVDPTIYSLDNGLKLIF